MGVVKKNMRNKVGIWSVYDLEANREIQKLLMEKGFAFHFTPNSNEGFIEYAFLCSECCTILEMPCFIDGECPECKSKLKSILYLKK